MQLPGVDVVSGRPLIRLVWKPCTANLLKLVIGCSLLLARAQARDRLGYTTWIVAAGAAVMPVAWWAGLRSTRAGMARRREIVRFKLHLDEWLRLGTGLAATDALRLAGNAVVRAERHGLELADKNGRRADLESQQPAGRRT